MLFVMTFVLGMDVGFCTLGTTRRDAGSAENFCHIDLHTTAAFAAICKSAEIPRFHLGFL